MRRVVKKFFKNKYRSIFEFGQKFGINILPQHFYSTIPDIRYLKQNDFWLGRGSMIGVEMNSLDEQLQLAKTCCAVEKHRELSLKNIYGKAVSENGEEGGFGVVEAEFLHCFIKFYKPKKIAQVGCGVSTAVILNAASEINHSIELTCVEPYPSQYLSDKNNANEISLIVKKAQEVDIEVYTQLSEGDMLFIDSTHAVKPGSEVNFLMFEILPRLKKGTVVHFHDIYFPFDYGRNLLSNDLFFWQENSLLHAFLIGNKKFKIMICQSMLHYKWTNELREIFTNYIPQENYYGLAKGKIAGKHFPASVYLKVVE